ncbi:MAG TPA: hypothetical protein VMT38_05485 [Terracidiphilus sp.]|nr:hypothetical protein [Terracidiphilus sp.]
MPGDIRIFASVGRSGANIFGDVAIVQQLLNLKLPDAGRSIFSRSRPGDSRLLDVDGLCGPATIAAIEAAERRHLGISRPTGKVEPGDATFEFFARDLSADALGVDGLGNPQIAWGARVSPAFKARLIEAARNIGVDPNFLVSAIAFETGETFSASIQNASGATGLIQFTPATATELGTSTAELAALPAEDQMHYVEQYLLPYRNMLETVEDVYMAILWPAAVGKPNSWVLFSEGSPEYGRNAGLDTDRDGNVTKGEAGALIRARLLKGRREGYFG